MKELEKQRIFNILEKQSEITHNLHRIFSPLEERPFNKSRHHYWIHDFKERDVLDGIRYFHELSQKYPKYKDEYYGFMKALAVVLINKKIENSIGTFITNKLDPKVMQLANRLNKALSGLEHE